MAILLSFIAANNDLDHGSGDYGPNVNLFRSENFRASISMAIFLYKNTSEQKNVIEYLTMRLKSELGNSFSVKALQWDGDDPTDHKTLFREMRRLLTEIDSNIRKKEPLWIHVTPGTPAMHAVWLLLAETGGITGSFKLFKSYRIAENHLPEDIDIHADLHNQVLFYKTGSEDRVMWDPNSCHSSPMKNLFSKAAMMARLNVPILLLGERGTGKTTLAKWIRNNSPLKNSKLREWPTIACGQYNDQLMTSELFGHKKGSFTGAHENRDGILTLLHEDTLFLDEIGDVSINMQRLLIRAIEEKSFIPLGGSETIYSNFRLISATNLSLDVLQERLHPDFFDRISVFMLEIPPLRKIKEELDWLWYQVFFSCRQKAQLPKILNLSDKEHESVIEYLKKNDVLLPGNIRDLAQLSYLTLGYLSSNLTSQSSAQKAIEDFELYTGNKASQKVTQSDQAHIVENENESTLANIRNECQKYFNLNSPLDGSFVIDQIKDALAKAAMVKSGNNKKQSAALLNLKDGKSIDAWNL